MMSVNMHDAQMLYDPDDLMFTYKLLYSDSKRNQLNQNKHKPIYVPNIPKPPRKRYRVEPRKAHLQLGPKESQPQSPAPQASTQESVAIQIQQPVLRKYENHIPCAFSIIQRGNIPSFEMPF